MFVLAILCLLLLPLGLRYYTSWRMTTLREALAVEEAEVAELKERYIALREELRTALSQKHQYEARKSFLSSDVDGERRKLAVLRRPTEDATCIAA